MLCQEVSLHRRLGASVAVVWIYSIYEISLCYFLMLVRTLVEHCSLISVTWHNTNSVLSFYMFIFSLRAVSNSEFCEGTDSFWNLLHYFETEWILFLSNTLGSLREIILLDEEPVTFYTLFALSSLFLYSIALFLFRKAYAPVLIVYIHPPNTSVAWVDYCIFRTFLSL